MFNEKTHSQKMDKAIDVLSKELSSLRTGRANAAMLDLIKVDVYGQQMPINQVGSITTPEPRMINIQVWDTNNVSLVDAAMCIDSCLAKVLTASDVSLVSKDTTTANFAILSFTTECK